jgi:hypothetical protein
MLFFTRFQPFKRVVKRVLNGIYFFSGIAKKFKGNIFKKIYFDYLSRSKKLICRSRQFFSKNFIIEYAFFDAL